MFSSLAVGIGYYLVGTGTVTSVAVAARGLARAAGALTSGQVKLATAHVLEAALDPLWVARRACEEFGQAFTETARQTLASAAALADRVVTGVAIPAAQTFTSRRRRPTPVLASDGVPAPSSAGSA
jgi:hypothetical protein